MPPSNAAQRVQALSQQLPASTSQAVVKADMATQKKPPITCHVLDTSLGRPAASIPVTLTLHNPHASASSSSAQPLKFGGTTDSDGRVTSWTPTSPFSSAGLDEVFAQEGDQKYSLTFATEAYFGARGVETFFPEVEVKFVVRQVAKAEHYHVPVLLGPFGYTTYRGS